MSELERTALSAEQRATLETVASGVRREVPSLTVTLADWAGGFGGVEIHDGATIVTVAPVTMYKECDRGHDYDACRCLQIGSGPMSEWIDGGYTPTMREVPTDTLRTVVSTIVGVFTLR